MKTANEYEVTHLLRHNYVHVIYGRQNKNTSFLDSQQVGSSKKQRNSEITGSADLNLLELNLIDGVWDE